MNTRFVKLLKWLTPPVLTAFVRTLRGKTEARYVWEGVYDHFRDVPTAGAGHESSEWLEMTLEYTKGLLACRNTGPLFPEAAIHVHSWLALLVASIAKHKKIVRILDFGGGLGASYIVLESSILDNVTLDYHIVEGHGICELGATLFASDKRIHFHTSLPDDLRHVDVAYANSAFQYVENYNEVLKQILALQPEYVLFVRLSAGANRTFATAQTNIPGSVLSYWFLNLDEVKGLMSAAGYTLRYEACVPWSRDQSNLPPDCRLDGLRNLLFSRNER